MRDAIKLLIGSRQLRQNGFAVGLYIIITSFTSAHFLGDTIDYARSIVLYNEGRYFEFWEFGHLLWRPLGWLLARASLPLTSLIVGKEPTINVTLVLLAINWLAGLLSVLSLNALLGLICRNILLINVSISFLIISQAFLNFCQSGAPYIPGLSLLLLGFYLNVRAAKSESLKGNGVLVAMCLAGSVSLWLPFVLALPAILVAPLFFSQNKTQALRLTIYAGVLSMIIIAVLYAIVVFGILGIRTVADLRDWMKHTTGSAHYNWPRTVFGLARSFIYMGQDGMLVKRYLVHDPFNPVMAMDLFRLSIWKLLAFYLFLASLIANLLLSTEGKKVFLLFVLNCLPVIAFAIYWQGGDPERYLPLYPLLLVSLAFSLEHHAGSRSIFRYLTITFVVMAAITNIYAMATPRLNRQNQSSADRLGPLVARLTPESIVFTANWQDELVNFNRSFPFHSINRQPDLRITAVVTPGDADVSRWRETFSTRTISTWQQGGDVWLSKRLFNPHPKWNWNWVEGDDPDISWIHLVKFFSQLKIGESIGGDDGFVLLLPSKENKEYFEGFVSGPNP